MNDQKVEEMIEKPKKSRHVICLILKITGWMIMAMGLFIIGIVMGVVNILTPERLTPLTERIATQSLQNAEVNIEKVELTVMKTFPFVHADISNLVVLSTVRSTLDEELSNELPAYTDTVLSVRGFSGGLNVMKLFVNQFDLSDVTITHPSANLVIINEEKTNFDIIPPRDEKDEEEFNWEEMPGISLKRFTIVDPGKLRFYNYETETELSASFTKVELDGSKSPMYTLHFDGNIDAPSELLEVFNIPNLKFGLNGSMKWSQAEPTLLSLENFDFMFSILGGCINTEVDFADGVTFNKLNVKLRPLDITQLLKMVPEDIAEEFDIPLPDMVETDAKLNLTFNLDKPWNIGSDIVAPFTLKAEIPDCSFEGYDFHTNEFAANLTMRLNSPWDMSNSLPDISFSLNVPPTSLRWNDLFLEVFSTDVSVNIPKGDLSEAEVDIKELNLKGPATDLKVRGTIHDLIFDPYFDGTIEGETDLQKLPEKVRNAIDGTLTGKISAQIDMRGSPSMFTPENFHKLDLNGDITFNNLYWVSGDTVNMVDVDRALFHFGSTEKLQHESGFKIDSLFRVSLKLDSALIVHSDLAFNIKDFEVSLASQNTSERLKEGRINPMGGKMSLKTFNLLKNNDSTVVRLRDIKGTTVIKAYNNELRTPELFFDFDAKRIAMGDSEMRLLLSNTHARVNARKVAKSKSAQRFTQIADSIHRSHPHLSPDSVMIYALEIHNRHRSKYPRVHEVYDSAESVDILDWGASPMFKRILSLWTFDMSLKSDRAGFFTPYMPLRNRFKNLNITCNNDSLTIKNLEYKIGHSDFTVNGVASNMRKAFTSPAGRQPLRINFETLSDTIDINQITDAIMFGNAYAASPKDKHYKIEDKHGMDEEKELEEHLARITENAPDTIMPILIPENIDAQLVMKANHVLYSDFDLKNMSGRLLAYDGALNLKDLKADSEVGNIDISALYSGLRADDLQFGFGLKLKDFNLHRFLRLVPAIDSIMPVMRDFSGIISADIAATVDIDKEMNLVIPTLDAAIGIQGDSLVLLDPETFKHVSKWLLFKDKNRNIIDHMDVQMIVKDNQVDIYPFVFDFDRYKLGVQGYNDFDMNFSYHIAVLKSPIPFKFGINISGNPDKFKVRLGGSKFGEEQIRQVAIVDTLRINLMNEINNVFRRGAREARLARLNQNVKPLAAQIDLSVDSLTHADSLRFMEEGLIESFPNLEPDKNQKNKKGKKHKTATINNSSFAPIPVLPLLAVLPTRKRGKRVRA